MRARLLFWNCIYQRPGRASGPARCTGQLRRFTFVFRAPRPKSDRRRQAQRLKKGKKNKDSKKNVSSNVRIDGFENTDANL
jgi:hypothetical protein